MAAGGQKTMVEYITIEGFFIIMGLVGLFALYAYKRGYFDD